MAIHLNQDEVAAFKKRWADLGQAAQVPRDLEPYGEDRINYLAAVNRQRSANGMPPLCNDRQGIPGADRAAPSAQRSVTHMSNLRDDPYLHYAMKFSIH